MKKTFPDSGRQLEQWRECRSRCAQLEQRPHECEQQHRVPSSSLLTDSQKHSLTRQCPCLFKKDAEPLPIGKIYGPQPLDASGDCLFQEIISFDNLLAAAYACRAGRSRRAPTVSFFAHLEEEIIALQNELNWGMYQPREYKHFYVFEPKRRKISAPHFRDRVVHRAIYNVVNPYFDARYIHDSYACRQGKGTHRGADRAQSFLRKIETKHGRAYALKADIYHYFSSINHCTLKMLLRQKIGCERTVELLSFVLDTSPSDSDGVGIPLGNLTSQMFANIYLHELDLFAKHELRAKHYIRYMDDFVLLHHDKSVLHRWRTEIELFLADALQLRTNSKTQIFPVAIKGGRALDFLGYRIYSTHRLLRKCSVKRIKTKLKSFHKAYARGEIDYATIHRSITSWLGHAGHANAYKLTQKLLAEPFQKGDSNYV